MVFLWPESKMSSPHTDSAFESLSTKPGMENQLVLSESPEKDEENPFTVPPDIFSIMDKEIKKAKAERERMKTMKVHEKITYSTKRKAKPKELRKALLKEEKEECRKQAADKEKLKTLQERLSSKAIKREYPLIKETFHEYMNNKRVIFLLKYDMAVKQEEIQKLKKIIKNEERKVEKAENHLEKEAAMFDEFLKENHKTSFQALKIAEKETAAKTKKILEVRAMTSQIEKLQSDITRFKTILQEYKMYRDFLYQLSPKEWQEENRKKHTKEKDLETASKDDEEIASAPTTAEQGQGLTAKTNTTSPHSTSHTDVPSSLLSPRSLEFSSLHEIRPQLRNFLKPLSTGITSSLEDAESETSLDEDEEPKLYFTDPQQLLSIFTEMEDENLSLIQKAQEVEERLAKVQHAFITTHESMEEELAELKQQVVSLKSSVAKEEETVADLKLNVQLFSSAEHKAYDQDKILTSLNEKVLGVYLDCTGKNETNLQTIQMLMVIEKQVNDLLDSLEKIPPAKIEQVEKAKRKERLIRRREEKLRLQKQQQEERSQRALERALATTEKKVSTGIQRNTSPQQLTSEKLGVL
ncbi:cilia- and flagella-associated protein 100 [Phaenicophaeus curvirostris]|uniref:cilia- and flagella-associated protein 100 n=1 Tax=Phaenicophaeus curvirostris TaxID=33595 RepID=UPI0037F0F61B